MVLLGANNLRFGQKLSNVQILGVRALDAEGSRQEDKAWSLGLQGKTMGW